MQLATGCLLYVWLISIFPAEALFAWIGLLALAASILTTNLLIQDIGRCFPCLEQPHCVVSLDTLSAAAMGGCSIIQLVPMPTRAASRSTSPAGHADGQCLHQVNGKFRGVPERSLVHEPGRRT